MTSLRAYTLAPSTKRTYASYFQTYINFCALYDLPALPAMPTNICRYITFLSRSKTPTSIPQYLTVIRLLHLLLDLTNPIKDNFQIDSLLTAVKRHKAKEICYKMTLSCSDLLAIRSHLDLNKPPDAQIWSLILTCFFGLLRISNVTVPSKHYWDPQKTINREDLTFHDTGCVLTIRWAKTIQLKERTLAVALPRLDNLLCPTLALINLLRVAGPVAPTSPAWSLVTSTGHLDVPTPASIRPRLHTLISAIGKPPSEYNTHSLRRSGASYLLSVGVPIEAIKLMGDWKSDSVFKYLKPLPCQRLHMANSAFKK
jgi:hypothetical protein